MWDFHGWAFAVPTNPLTIFLDCRTQRYFDAITGPPRLLNEEALASILHIAKEANYRKGDPIILASPTPVFGFDIAEGVQKFLARISGTYRWDLETWAANEAGYIRFLSFLAENFSPSYCIFLSGDVHYGFTMAGNFALLRGQQQHAQTEVCLSMPVVQLTSSALKSSSLAGKLLVSGFLGLIHRFFFPQQTIRAGWTKLNIPEFVSNSEISKSIILPKKPRLNNNNLVTNEQLLLPPMQAILNKPPISADRLASLYNISPPPDWVELRTLVYDPDVHASPIVSDNNVGLVNFGTNSLTITHKLFVREGKATKIRKATTGLQVMS